MGVVRAGVFPEQAASDRRSLDLVNYPSRCPPFFTTLPCKLLFLILNCARKKRTIPTSEVACRHGPVRSPLGPRCPRATVGPYARSHSLRNTFMSDGVHHQAEAPASLFAELDSRDVAVWLQEPFAAAAGPEKAAKVLGLPWAFVFSESSDQALITALEATESVESPLVRRRGIIHIVDTNPSDVPLPPRSLPVFLLNGRGGTRNSGLAALTRRLTMLEELQRRSIKHLVVLGGPTFALPQELTGLWAEGFRSFTTVVSDASDATDKAAAWRAETGARTISLVTTAAGAFVDDLVRRYMEGRDERQILRLRDATETLHRLDVTGLDDPEHPLLGRYELLTEEHLIPLLPDDLRVEDVEGFFKDPRSSWRPFAAGMPWPREPDALNILKRALRKLDREAGESNPLFYVSAESGAGATTFIRNLAWETASEGYPTLLAAAAPFTPSSVEVTSYMSRCMETATKTGIGADTRLYQAPWLIVFDRTALNGHEDDLIHFSRELEKSGRRACIVFVTDSVLPIAIYEGSRFKRLAVLTHQVSKPDAVELGRHLNRYLLKHGTVRSEAEWNNFLQRSIVGPGNGYAAFWIALSFWLRRLFDMEETIQSWLYYQFHEKVTDPVLRHAIIDIAAMSTVHRPLPEVLLPASHDWPTADKLCDIQSGLGALGIVRGIDSTQRYWALIHDLLGRFLLTALFYDRPALEAAGFGEATNPEHLRLLVLKRIARLPGLAHRGLREVAEAFATSIFKIDPSHGHALFAPYWREALVALDEMPRAFRTTSRAFLHHAAISRRRIAKDKSAFDISDDERAELLSRAISDIETALSITGDADGESDMNLLNSLAHAYHDLAEVEVQRRAKQERIQDLQTKARDATRRAYRLSPDNSFVVETYARDLLTGARSDPTATAGNAIEVLGLVYAAMQRGAAEARRFALGRLAEAALDVLLEVAGEFDERSNPQTESDAIIVALKSLAEGVRRFEGMELNDYPATNRIRAAEHLANPILRSNAQAVRLQYLLCCMDRPQDFAQQLEFLESLKGSSSTFTPQMDLELAVLLHQRDRHHEAARKFHELRQRWQREEHFVEVPERLKWLRVRDRDDRRQVRARISQTGDGRHRARVSEMQGVEVTFRPQEFGREKLRPGMVINGYISFGHNGPFLRPLTAN